MKKVFFLACWFALLWSSAAPVVIIIHGSFAADHTWWTPEGEFCQEVQRTAGYFGERVVPFCWTGYPTDRQVDRAALMLANLILSYPRNERVTIIAHSFAGNIVSRASTHLFVMLEKLCAPLSSRPIREILEKAYQELKERPPVTAASFVMPLPGQQLHGGLDNTVTLRQLSNIQEAVTKFIASGGYSKKNIIDRAIYLGTPVDEERFPPRMDVIGSLINLYSAGDRVQPVIGFYQRAYKDHAHIANVQVLVKQKGVSLPVNPSHGGVHAPIIGRWLLLLPEVLAHYNDAEHNFKAFAYGKKGIIEFDEQRGPRYIPSHQRKQYLASINQHPVKLKKPNAVPVKPGTVTEVVP